MKRVTVFKADGEIKDCMTKAVIDAVVTMKDGEYGYVWSRERWVLKGANNNKFLSHNYTYILDSSVPEELKMKLVLLQ